ncbi:putative HVA22 protein g [Trifolium repens]|nr:putative HVA22 protein g [Trifolium repens]
MHRSNLSISKSFILVLHLPIFQIDVNEWNPSNRSSIVRIQIIHYQIVTWVLVQKCFWLCLSMAMFIQLMNATKELKIITQKLNNFDFGARVGIWLLF